MRLPRLLTPTPSISAIVLTATVGLAVSAAPVGLEARGGEDMETILSLVTFCVLLIGGLLGLVGAAAVAIALAEGVGVCPKSGVGPGLVPGAAFLFAWNIVYGYWLDPNAIDVMTHWGWAGAVLGHTHTWATANIRLGLSPIVFALGLVLIVVLVTLGRRAFAPDPASTHQSPPAGRWVPVLPQSDQDRGTQVSPAALLKWGIRVALAEATTLAFELGAIAAIVYLGVTAGALLDAGLSCHGLCALGCLVAAIVGQGLMKFTWEVSVLATVYVVPTDGGPVLGTLDPGTEPPPGVKTYPTVRAILAYLLHAVIASGCAWGVWAIRVALSPPDWDPSLCAAVAATVVLVGSGGVLLAPSRAYWGPRMVIPPPLTDG